MNKLINTKGAVPLSNCGGKPDEHLIELYQFLKDFFLDPQTSLLDHREFRIDVYETYNEVIVEALLDNYRKKDITVTLDGYHMVIEANKNNKTKKRSIDFPFSVIHRDVHAIFQNNILEVFIGNKHLPHGQNRLVTIH